MKRRNLLLSIGGTALGGSALLGSGAFSRIESQRDVTIQVAEDADAYLGLDKCDSPNGSYAHPDDKGHLAILLDDTNPTVDDTPLGSGINSDSNTWFDRVFQICNQGKEAVCVWIADDNDWPRTDDDERRVEFYLEDDDSRSIIGEDNRIVLGLGECACIGIRTRSHGLAETDRLLDAIGEEITIIADTDCFTTPDCVEQDFHYLSSSRPRVDNELGGDEKPGTEIFAVELDGDTEVANLHLLETLPADNFDQVDAMAANPAGDALYLYDRNSGYLGRLDLLVNGAGTVESDGFEEIGPVAGDPGGVVLATFAQDGTLYVASQNSDSVYTVDDIETNPSLALVGDTGIAVQGADMAFDAIGVLHLFSNATNTLYTINTNTGEATALCSGIDNLTGLAFTDGGTGELLGSLSGFPGGMDGEIQQFDSGCTVNIAFEMILADYDTNPASEGEQYVYTSGDMATGRLCVPIQESF